MKQRNFRSLAIVAGLALAASSAYAQVKIAYIDPLSGPFANVGEAGLKGFKEAADILVNQKGGIKGQKLEFVGFDNKGSPRKARSSSRRRSTRAFVTSLRATARARRTR
jgi:branched-chain amino acid transport system substrate-binding protein